MFSPFELFLKKKIVKTLSILCAEIVNPIDLSFKEIVKMNNLLQNKEVYGIVDYFTMNTL
jgi:hypothetical protein